MRSLLYVPAHQERFIAKAHERGADAIILDLEDSVPAEAKDGARAGLAAAINSVRQGGAQVFVRINDGERQHDDARAAIKAGADGLYVPKVRSAYAIESLAVILDAEEAGGTPLQLVALIEDIGAVMDARSIARASRLTGLSVGGEDLALSLGAEPTPDVLRLPKLLVHYAAKDRGLWSFGLLRSAADYSDLAGIELAAREAQAHGFDGATCVHPAVVPVLNTAFSPSADMFAWAERVIEAARTGEGAFQVDGKMVDAPIIARARRILELRR
ncbi:citrate lyase [Devosia soli]|uniref:Citrate lyase n=1 Tax=Devosia soli TaxID=361041 RepID=A0A0F5L6G8_9HYPH|nr:CoA ester lyase [Devosia soli]KKB78001.1 citrate lyase [Devosia soli]